MRVVEPELQDLWTGTSQEALDRTVAVAQRGLRAPISVLTSYETGQRILRSSIGIEGRPEFRSDYDMPCQRVFMTGTPLMLPDRSTPNAPRQSYIGVPVRLPSGRIMATLCVIDHEPRNWGTAEADVLHDVASSLAEHIALGLELEARERADSARLAEILDINHKLRTPLQTIVGFSEFLKTETRQDLIAAHARTIQTAAESALGIINQTLAEYAARADAVQSTAIDVQGFAESCLSMMGVRVKEKRLESRLEVDADVPRLVTLDRQRVFQALLNLLNNAVKFTDRGSITLAIASATAGLRFSVVDTGIGIASDQRAFLFRRFSRLDTEPRRTDGTGLGLAITKALVESMQGTIGVSANAHGGSIFWFDVPCTISTAVPSPVQIEVHPVPVTPEACAGRILVADDLDLNRKLIADMLSIEGYVVDVVADGAAAVDAVAAGDYDLVLMDMIMPGMNGLTAARAIRALPAPACDVSIVALTANCGRDQLDSCLRAGMNATLTKPMTFDALTQAASTWIRAKTAAA